MFEPRDTPRLYGLAPGVDFPRALVEGLIERTKSELPETLARVTLYLNTRRMARRVKALFVEQGALLLPRIRLITDLANDPQFVDLPQPINPLARRLELAQLVRKLIEQQPDLAPQASAFDLADSLATLMEEMQGEGVVPAKVAALDVGDHSAHWKRSQEFLAIVQTFFGDDNLLDTEARQRKVVERLTTLWQSNPPKDPIIVAGSTGSRGTTRVFMEAVAKLPRGAVVLPGFDFDMPSAIWDGMDDEMAHEDHPQFRFHVLMRALGISKSGVETWHDRAPNSPARNALISLALRPAPVTDGWLRDGPKLKHIDKATAHVTLLQAASPRVEATAIALRLRDAVERGQSAAVITPDRTLTRQITAALQRWDIEPDDSAGIPLQLTPPGRLLRQTAGLMGAQLSAEALLALLKHPLVGASDRANHLRFTRDLELGFLRGGPPFPTSTDIQAWATKQKDADVVKWADWLGPLIDSLGFCTDQTLLGQLDTQLNLTERLAAGPGSDGSGGLWEERPGQVTLETVTALREAAPHGGILTTTEHADLLHAILSKAEVRNPILPHPNVMIWGTLEARVQGADLVILAGLNEGSWPELPSPDAWLNRQMRKDAGLLLPERRIGLSAHDFQQAIAAPEVWLTRSTRDAEAETVPSRWINRLTNLMEGLPETGKPALGAMKARADQWLSMATDIDHHSDKVEPAKRPSPQPPVAVRPDKLSVTRIEWLIRDPYAIYARYILKLKPLTPLQASPDAPLKGRALHDVFQTFIETHRTDLPDDAAAQLAKTAQEVFSDQVPWVATRTMWAAKLARNIDWFIQTEQQRRAIAQPVMFEKTSATSLVAPKFTLQGRADRIDQTPDGQVIVYDYKTGILPNDLVQKHFDKQLPLLAAIIARGGIDELGTPDIRAAAYIGMGSNPAEKATHFDADALGQVWDELALLIASYSDRGKGYSSRRAMQRKTYSYDYDHLARLGEWNETDEVSPQLVGPKDAP